jgi:hypothetical protein
MYLLLVVFAIMAVMPGVLSFANIATNPYYCTQPLAEGEFIMNQVRVMQLGVVIALLKDSDCPFETCGM